MTGGDKKRAVAISSVVASAAMVLMKLVVGLMTGSLGLLSEAAHSLLDLGAAGLTWFAVHVSDQPPDERHPYGHGKVESVSALIETGLLFLTSLWIIKEAVSRLLDPVPVQTTWYAVGVIVVSIVIDLGRSRALAKVAKETQSQALEADALHFATDILSSTAVLAGLVGVALGWLQADAVAALGVAVVVFVAGYRMGKRTVDALIDAAPEGVAEQVREVVEALPDVVRVAEVRARPAGSVVFVDLTVKVSRTLPFPRVEALRALITERLGAALPQVEALVVAEPLALDDESIVETVKVAAANRGLSVHDIGAHLADGVRQVSFDLEVDDRLTIRAAHDIATALEQELMSELGPDVGVDIHIDPRRMRVGDAHDLPPDEHAALVAVIEEIAGSVDVVRGVHHIRARRSADGLFIAFHCAFKDSAPVRIVHDATFRLEHLLRERIPQASRVVVHAEPEDHVDGPEPGAAAG